MTFVLLMLNKGEKKNPRSKSVNCKSPGISTPAAIRSYHRKSNPTTGLCMTPKDAARRYDRSGKQNSSLFHTAWHRALWSALQRSGGIATRRCGRAPPPLQVPSCPPLSQAKHQYQLLFLGGGLIFRGIHQSQRIEGQLLHICHMVGAFTLTPCSKSTCTISMLPFSAASCKGVRDMRPVALPFASAPAAINSLTSCRSF